ncbi:MAG: HD domain-containing protein [Clostridium sp.]|nr:HD domain-containing protein [Clostridium sp.]MCM1444360.1 HD domain-containing protein [Candidatus Amulumruptor caecigallinarius]
MQTVHDDVEYMNLVGHILDNSEFNKIKNIEHHGITRFEHSLRVSYYSYKVSKFLKLDYKQVATGGLLHDFFLSDDERTKKDKFKSFFSHPKKAVKKSYEQFKLTDKEQDIIRTHMFPMNPAIPKYAESWVVSFVDKVVGVYEFSRKFGYKLVYAANLFIVFILNSIK